MSFVFGLIMGIFIGFIIGFSLGLNGVDVAIGGNKFWR